MPLAQPASILSKQEKPSCSSTIAYVSLSSREEPHKIYGIRHYGAACALYMVFAITVQHAPYTIFLYVFLANLMILHIPSY